MANIKSAKKRILVSRAKNARNKAGKSELRTFIKKARADGADLNALKEVTSKLDKAVTKGFIHKNKAARLKSRLTKKITAVNA